MLRPHSTITAVLERGRARIHAQVPERVPIALEVVTGHEAVGAGLRRGIVDRSNQAGEVPGTSLRLARALRRMVKVT